MRSRADIEKLLAHMRSPECPGDPAVNAVWIKALEWVLGGEQFRRNHEEFLKLLEATAGQPFDPPGPEEQLGERILRLNLRLAIERLR